MDSGPQAARRMKETLATAVESIRIDYPFYMYRNGLPKPTVNIHERWSM